MVQVESEEGSKQSFRAFDPIPLTLPSLHMPTWKLTLDVEVPLLYIWRRVITDRCLKPRSLHINQSLVPSHGLNDPGREGIAEGI